MIDWLPVEWTAAATKRQTTGSRHVTAFSEQDREAVQPVHSDGTSDYMSVTELDPKYWDYNLNTMLVSDAVRSAVAGGRRSVIGTHNDLNQCRDRIRER